MGIIVHLMVQQDLLTIFFKEECKFYAFRFYVYVHLLGSCVLQLFNDVSLAVSGVIKLTCCQHRTATKTMDNTVANSSHGRRDSATHDG